MNYIERMERRADALRERKVVRILAIETSCDETAAAVHALVNHLGASEAHFQVTTWNDAAVLGSTGQPLLERAGFYRDYPGMSWERRRA